MNEFPRLEKLIRDAIPDLLDEVRRRDLRRVTDAEVIPYVAHKILEEAQETFEAVRSRDVDQLVEELADLADVIDRLMTLHGIDPAHLAAVRDAKRRARGPFDANWLLARPPRPVSDGLRVWTGPGDRFASALEAELATCDRANLAVAFGLASSLPLVAPPFRAALARGARIRLLTSDYLDVTEPDFLLAMLDLAPALELRVHREPGRSFHPKAYLFERSDGRHSALIGSSNLSRSALESGIEWNYRVHAADAGWPVHDMLDRFDALWAAPEALPVDRDWIMAYAVRREPRPLTLEPAPRKARPVPNAPQREALAALAALRMEGETKGLVIAATGIGKTYLAAFDSAASGRVLFLAHREELLRQARETFVQVRPDATTGFVGMGQFEAEADCVFASVATLSRPEHLGTFAPDHFDYIVVDEVHHGAAPGYRTVLHHFTPRFLLGLTATPYRADNRDVLGLCDGNVAYRVGIHEAIALGWLSPLHYRGVLDPTDYDQVPWRGGRYDEEALSTAVATRQRAEIALAAYREHVSRAALGFCVSIRHAEFMARYFREQGVPAIAVHSGPGAADRQEAIASLRAGQVCILFTVDLFNEGVDIPEVDLVLFLRPTESPTVFLQQLGRGLRLHPGKERLEVLDLIGNHRGVHRKFPLLLGRDDVEAPARDLSPVLEALRSRELVLPRGISLDLDLQVIDLLTQLARKGEPLRDAMLEAHRELAAELGHAPSLMETHRWGRFPVRLLRREFGTWNRYLEAAGALAPVQAALEAEAGGFLAEVEKTQMTKSYKMVLLEAFVRRGGLTAPVALEVLVEDFRRFFLESPRHRKDLEGADLGDLERVSAEKLRDHVLRNPVAAWLNPGKGGRTVFFERSGDALVYVGPRPRDGVAFEEAVLVRVAWRLAAYFETRYERVDTFKVMHSGEKGIIMLGDNSRGVVPRDQGWKPVQVGGREMWAKFAKVAINVLKEFPRDDAPNRMTEVLEELFGPGGFRSDRRNRVRIVPGEGERWCISPVGPGADGGRGMSGPERKLAAAREGREPLPDGDAGL